MEYVQVCVCFMTVWTLSVADPTKVTVIRQSPFVFVTDDTDKTGNARYTGFIPDLMDLLASRIGFKYTLHEVTDGKFGSFDNDKSWNGMIGELIRGDADIAAAPMTITAERSKYVTFTPPFMTTGVSLLVHKRGFIHRPYTDDHFSYFLIPFALEVWLVVFVSTIVVASLFYVINRFNPYEIVHKGEAPGEHDNCGVLGSLWLALGGLVLQGFSRRPRSAAAFILILTWWVVSLIIFATYVVNLTSFLSVMNEILDRFDSFDALSKQTGFRLTAVKPSPTWNFFCNSKDPVNTRICGLMGDGVGSIEEGVKRVSAGNTGFFETSPFINYKIEHDCRFAKFGSNLNTGFFGLAIAKNSTLTEHLKLSITEMRETGNLAKLEHKWWRMKDECENGTKIVMPGQEQPQQEPLQPNQMASALLIPLAGVVLAAIAFAIEVIHHRPTCPKGKGKDTADVLEEQQTPPTGANETKVDEA